MKSNIIVIKGNKLTEESAARCEASTKIFIERFDAITPDNVDSCMAEHNVRWTYPWKEKQVDFASGMELSPYPTVNPKSRMACFMSHYLLWKQCAEGKDPFMILEHDAIFTRALDIYNILNNKYQIVGINDPRSATRKSQLFHDMIQKTNAEIQPVPKIDNITVPQGLAGNSAYIIKPEGAQQMLKLVEEYGAWPNDALMCRQLVQGLGVTKTYYTKVQGTQSTTSL